MGSWPKRLTRRMEEAERMNGESHPISPRTEHFDAIDTRAPDLSSPTMRGARAAS